jgi:SHS2 domain-containing protein
LRNRPPVGVRFLEHTADTGIRVRARSLAGCFARTAAGMFACFTAPVGVGVPYHSIDIDVSAEGWDEVMVIWLEELLFASETKGLALHEFLVERARGGRVSGSARGPRFGRGAMVVGPAVKGITRHGLEVHRLRGHWEARVYFDV